MELIVKELIKKFMKEAKDKHDLRSGTNEEYSLAIGLVDVSISFEALINSMNPLESSISKKRAYFSTTYQSLFMQYRSVFSVWVTALKEEVDTHGPVEDMSPQSSHHGAPKSIANSNELAQIIEVIYRVRCNLVHGSKDLTQRRNKVLIENSFRFLYNLLIIIFRNEGII
jgi:hypothetical protein